MKKILIIMPNDFSNLAGTENYNLFLMNILFTYYTNFEIDLFSVDCKSNPVLPPKYQTKFVYYHLNKYFGTDSLIKKTYSLFSKVIECRKEFKKIYKDYDLILDSSQIGFPKASQLKNYYLIQHLDFKQYYLAKFISKQGINSWIRKLIRHLTNTYNLVKFANNLVVFDKPNQEFISSYCLNANIFAISLPSKINSISINELNSAKRNHCIFLGRLSDQKNINALIQINKQLNLIDFYGKSNDAYGDKCKQELSSNNWYMGSIDGQQELINTLKKYKFMILYSKYEGFPFSLVEALSQGVPIIVKNTFLSASYLCNSKTGLLLPASTTIEEDIELIKKFVLISNEKYHQLQINCVDFYNENLNINIFTNKWMKIFNQYLEKKN